MFYRTITLITIYIFLSQCFVKAQSIVITDSLSVYSNILPKNSTCEKVKGNSINYIFWDFTKNSNKLIFFDYNLKTQTQNFIPFNNFRIASLINSESPQDAIRIKDKLIILQANKIKIFKIKKNRVVSKKQLKIINNINYLNDFSNIYQKNDSEIYLFNEYNFYREDKLYDEYRIAIFNLKTGKIQCIKSLDLGKGIVTNFGMGQKFDSKNENIVLAHPTKLQFYLINNKLEITDTIFLPQYSSINTDSAFNECFTDSYLEATKIYPSNKIETMNNNGLYLYPHIEKIGWLDQNNILISAMNVDSIVPTNYSFAGNRILYIFNLKNRQFKEINYKTYWRFLPITISIDFHSNEHGIMSCLFEEYNYNDEIIRSLYLTRFHDSSSVNTTIDNQFTFPDSAYNIQGKIIDLDYTKISNVLFLDAFSCINCYSPKSLKKSYVFIVDNNMPRATKHGIYTKIETILNPSGIFFIKSKDLHNLPLNTLIPSE